VEEFAVSDLQKKFDAAAKAVTKLPKRPDNDQMLELYSLYKQASDGDVSGARPGMLDFTGRAKFDAWAKRKGTTRDAAMKSYVALVAKLQKG
jgi:acyl-CoA-binding protein